MNCKLRIIGNPIRRKNPPRKKYDSYRSKYKELLREDFNNRCGYCDTCEYCEDAEFFEIDHFKPRAKDKFPELADTYENFVYSCRTCNRAKASKWHDEYIDPCSTDFQNLFYRNKEGQIFPNEEGEQMWKDLRLYLLKRRFYWQLSTCYLISEKICSYFKNNSNTLTENEIKSLKEQLEKISCIMTEIKKVKVCGKETPKELLNF